MRKYYVYYWNNFANTYHLMYADGEEMQKFIPAGAQQITRKEALKMAAEECRARKDNPSFANYADLTIFPAGYDRNEKDIVNDPEYKCVNRIWERVK